MRDTGIRAAVAEVSSHAIALDRVWGVQFRCAVFTNITRDHLDYHKTFDEYRRVKTSFFEHLNPDSASAVINMDDPSFDAVLGAARRARLCRYSTKNIDADLFLRVDEHSLAGTSGRITVENRTIRFQSPLWGTFSHANLAAMAGAAHVQGISDKDISDGLAAFSGINGRIERVPSDAPFDVFVDYAHTPDALNAVLSSAKPLVKGRLLVLFGCGGDRDQGKRPEMARAVEHWADAIYLTSDNPRSEDPNSIIADVTVGFSQGLRVWSDPDRVRAIERSIGDAKPGDAVFLCGKGHEDTQEIAGVFHHFSDRETAAQILAVRGHAPQTPRGGGILPGSAVGPGGDPSPTRP
jgi:UDP-N-acetylmuramoyl-L-alanyl-D-glutamate--2,6-diaminopimelate ligase